MSDFNTLINLRAWLQDAVESKGAKLTGGGIGMGSADLDIELEGHSYRLTIKPIITKVKT